MTEIRARAPGKLILCGEYAVLGGAPGVAVAVEPFAFAGLVTADGGRLVVPGTTVSTAVSRSMCRAKCCGMAITRTRAR